MDLNVTGIRETMEMLDGLPRYMVLQGFSKALHNAGQILMGEIGRLAPVQLAYEGGELVVSGGELKAAIRKQVTLDSNYRGGYVVVDFGKQNYKANWIEWGHRMIGHKPQKKQLYGPRTPDGNVRPFPFIRPGAEAAAQRAVDAFVQSMIETILRIERVA